MLNKLISAIYQQIFRNWATHEFGLDLSYMRIMAIYDF